jgi:CTP-dependent riboflavin kinase
VFIIIPETPNYPSNQIEIISSINLRKKLELKNGEKMTLLIK